MLFVKPSMYCTTLYCRLTTVTIEWDYTHHNYPTTIVEYTYVGDRFLIKICFFVHISFRTFLCLYVENKLLLSLGSCPIKLCIYICPFRKDSRLLPFFCASLYSGSLSKYVHYTLITIGVHGFMKIFGIL